MEDKLNPFDDDHSVSTKPTQMFLRTQRATQKHPKLLVISHNSGVLTRGSNFFRPQEKRTISKGHIEVLRTSCANLPSFRSSSIYLRTTEFYNYKFRVKGWKRFDVKTIKVPSSNSSRCSWKLEIKDLDGTRTVLDQLKLSNLNRRKVRLI